MSDAYHHGVKITEIAAGVRAIRSISTAIIGLVATAEDADATVFPLNRPALITDALAAAGEAGTDGTLRDALKAISDQGSPIVVVVRVEAGASEHEVTANVIGDTEAGVYTGLQALLVAEAQLGVRPRIIGCPGLDTQAVTTAMVTVAKKLNAFGYAYAWDCTDVADVLTYREKFSARELMLIWPDFNAFDSTTKSTVAVSAVARALGLRAKIDQDTGWHKTLSNVAVNGVTGMAKDVHFDLQSSATDAGLLNEAGVTTLVNLNGGFRFWGSRTCSDDAAFTFESAARTAQVLRDTIANGVASFVDKPMHPSIAKDIVESIRAKLRSLVAQGYLIGADCWLDETVNTPDQLAGGTLRIDYDYTPVPPIENLQLQQRITDSYFADFAARVAAG